MKIFHFPVTGIVAGKINYSTKPLGKGVEGKGLHLSIKAEDQQKALQKLIRPANGDSWDLSANPKGE